jgi:hypothetical protein
MRWVKKERKKKGEAKRTQDVVPHPEHSLSRPQSLFRRAPRPPNSQICRPFLRRDFPPQKELILVLKLLQPQPDLRLVKVRHQELAERRDDVLSVRVGERSARRVGV